jgi:uncharacterized protein (DUF433 family)
MSSRTAYKHVNIDERGRAFVEGTAMKVADLILFQRTLGWSPEELHFQLPELSLAQIHSALAYYWDHRDVLDKQIEGEAVRIELMRKGNSAHQEPFVADLKARWAKMHKQA